MHLRRFFLVCLFCLFLVSMTSGPATAQTPSPALLVLEKDDHELAIVDPGTLKVVARVPAGEDPHEVVASQDGKFAYISNYGAFANPQHTLSVVDLIAQKPLPPIDLGVLIAPHGLQYLNGKVYFTAEGSKAIGSYDPAGERINWVLGVGQNRTHMIVVKNDLSRIFTSDVSSDTITIIVPDKNADVSGWTETHVRVGKGPEGFDVSPDDKVLWAANSHDGTVSIIDIGTKTVVQTVDAHVKSANRLKFTPDGRFVLISLLGSDKLIVMDATIRRVIKQIDVGGGAAGILMAPDGSQAYLAVSRGNYVLVIDLKALRISGRIQTGKGPDGMAWAVRK
jgi:YVTN family beta-propeller protein